MPVTITAYEILDEAIRLNWSDGRESMFHHVWLRDNCPASRHAETWERLEDVLAFDPDVRAVEAILSNDGGISIAWNDGHRSHFAGDWLRRHCYSEVARHERRPAPMT